MNEIEDILKAIMLLKDETGEFSLDIYFDDLKHNFVCKVHGFNRRSDIDGKVLSDSKHFRNDRLIDSLIDSFNFVKNKMIES